MSRRLFTSESVTEGHPDKICDQISDAILDTILAKDPKARVACETCTTTGIIFVMGEVTTNAMSMLKASLGKPFVRSVTTEQNMVLTVIHVPLSHLSRVSHRILLWV